MGGANQWCSPSPYAHMKTGKWQLGASCYEDTSATKIQRHTGWQLTNFTFVSLWRFVHSSHSKTCPLLAYAYAIWPENSNFLSSRVARAVSCLGNRVLYIPPDETRITRGCTARTQANHRQAHSK